MSKRARRGSVAALAMLALVVTGCRGAGGHRATSPTAEPPGTLGLVDDRRAATAAAMDALGASERGEADALSRLAALRDGGDLDDWRLLLLAESGSDRRAFERLLENHPESPLALAARRIGAQQALADAEPGAAFALLAPLLAGRVDEATLRLAWQCARAPDEILAVARAILDQAPQLLAPLEVTVPQARLAPVEFRAWAVAAAPVLARRGRALAGRRLLDSVPRGLRDDPWRVASARLELRLGRVASAAALVADPLPADPSLRSAARVIRAEVVLASKTGARSQRHTAALAALTELATAAASEDRGVTAEAARTLLANASDAEERFAAVALLALVDPADGSGPRALFEDGLAAWEAGDPAAALLAWQRLLDHPGANGWQAAASYWSARALAELGHHSAASARFATASQASGFYRHQTARHGQAPATPPAPEGPIESPFDPRLARAQQLLEAGLPRLALREAELLTEADPAARALVRARALSALERVREAATVVRAASSALGPGRLDRVPPEVLSLYYPLRHREAIAEWSRKRGVDPALVAGMIRQESAFDAQAVSHAGARGLLQLMPPTAGELARRERLPRPSGGDLHRPDLSLRLGTAYLAECLAMFDGEVELALAGYNAGPYRVRRWRLARRETPLDLFVERIPLTEPRDYVKRVLLHRDAYRELYPELGS